MLLRGVSNCLGEDEVVGVADCAHGYTGADLRAVVMQGEPHEVSVVSGSGSLPPPHFLLSPTQSLEKALGGEWRCGRWGWCCCEG